MKVGSAPGARQGRGEPGRLRASGFSSDPIIFSRVDLPLPERPTMLTNELLFIKNEALFTTVRDSYIFVTFLSFIAFIFAYKMIILLFVR